MIGELRRRKDPLLSAPSRKYGNVCWWGFQVDSTSCIPFQAPSLPFASFFAPHQPFGRWRGGSPIDRRLYEPSPIGPSSALSLGLDDAPRRRLGLASCIRGRRAQRKRHRICEQEYLARSDSRHET